MPFDKVFSRPYAPSTTLTTTSSSTVTSTTTITSTQRVDQQHQNTKYIINDIIINNINITSTSTTTTIIITSTPQVQQPQQQLRQRRLRMHKGEEKIEFFFVQTLSNLPNLVVSAKTGFALVSKGLRSIFIDKQRTAFF